MAVENLGTMRTLIAKHNGRFDLVGSTASEPYPDGGLDYFIEQAQDWLDENFPYKKQDAWLFKEITSGNVLITFQQARFIRECWVASTAEGRKKLDYIDFREWLKKYTSLPLSTQDTGAPLFWTHNLQELSPEHPSIAITGITLTGTDPVKVTLNAASEHRFVDGDDVTFHNVGGTTELNTNTYVVVSATTTTIDLTGTDSSDFTAWTSGGTVTKIEDDLDLDRFAFGDQTLSDSILIGPPADATYMVEILGAWHSNKLTDDAHTSFWTTKPRLLMRATNLMIEIDLHQNSQRTNDFETSLLRDLRQLYYDRISEESSGPASQFVMKG